MDNLTKGRSASAAILYQLSEQGRLVLSDWRAMLFLRRAAFSLEPSRRRWSTVPSEPKGAWPILRRMLGRGEIEPVRGIRHLYRASVPYARERALDEREVLMEVHPYACLGYLSALFYHGMTEEMPKVITAVTPADGKGGVLPPGTDADDWEGVELVKGRKVPDVLGWPVRWRSVKPAWYFGFELYKGQGYPLRVTTRERTLVDGLRDPELSGGLQNVLHAWASSMDLLDADSIVYQVERLGEVVLRQRVGFVMERLGLSHPALEGWSGSTERGGSRKLLASAPYAPIYDERWDLSINAPVDALENIA
jgi:predicted transcriptional regulator of viral defense system